MNLDDLLRVNGQTTDIFNEIFSEMVMPTIQPSTPTGRIHKTPKEKRILTSTPTVRVIKIENPEDHVISAY